MQACWEQQAAREPTCCFEQCFISESFGCKLQQACQPQTPANMLIGLAFPNPLIDSG